MFPYGFWDSSLWKEAARAGLRRISQMVSQGNLAGASQLATTPGVLKPSAAGSQIRHIGRGSEGMATMVAHPEHGVAVRKLYDPRGISSPEMIQRKEEVGRAIGDNQHFAKFLGSAPTPHGGGTMHFNEYVPSAPQPKRSLVPSQQELASRAQLKQQANATGDAARTAIKQTGYEGHDIRKGNMVQDARTGQHKVVDFIPGRTGEMGALDSSKPGQLTVSPTGAHLFNRAPYQTTNKGMLGGMLGGQVRDPNTGGHVPAAPKPMGVRRHVGVSSKNTLISGNVGDAPRRPVSAAPKGVATQIEGGAGRPMSSGVKTEVTPAGNSSQSAATAVARPSSMTRPDTPTVQTPQKPSTTIAHPPPPKPPKPGSGPTPFQQQRTQVLGT